MKPQAFEISELVKMFLNDELRLPEMQRKYVWSAPKVRDLIDSIYRDYPSGSILMWRVTELPETREAAIEPEEGKSAFSQKLLLLDGQQRITSLASIMTGKPIRVKDGEEVTERNIDLVFNLDHPERLSSSYGGLDQLNAAAGDDSKTSFFQINSKKIENLPN